MHELRNPSPIRTASSSSRPSQTSVLPSESEKTSADEASRLADQLHLSACQQDVFMPACCPKPAEMDTSTPGRPTKPSLAKLPGGKLPSSHQSRDSLGLGSSTLTPGANAFSRIQSSQASPSEHLLSSSERRDYSDLNQLMPSSVRRPREGVQPDTYPYESRVFSHPNVITDTVELMMERMGRTQRRRLKLSVSRNLGYLLYAVLGASPPS